MEQRLLFKRLIELLKQEQGSQSLHLLKDALCRGEVDPAGREKAGRLISKIRGSSSDFPAGARVILLGQFTTSWLANTLIAEGCERGLPLDVVEGQYDNVMQELMTCIPEASRPCIVVLLPWTKRLLYQKDSIQSSMEQELAFWKQAGDIVTNTLGARVLQVGFDWTMPGALGHHLAGGPGGEVNLMRRMNEKLRDTLPAGSFFLDLEQVSGTMGRDSFYDQRRYHWTKQPFSEKGVCLVAKHIFAGIRALVSGPKKVLVVDLDNTLWGGIVGEVGPTGISLGDAPDGEAYCAFQRHVRALSKRGVLLAACSKNNPDDARGPFEKNPDMVLRLENFAHIEASWDPKEIGLQHIAKTLNLGLDSFVFFDDNPAEREHIRQALPEVEVVDVPEDPADYIHALQAGLWFESVAISVADTHRARQYQQESQRRELQNSRGSLDDYLRSLDMRAAVSSIDETTLQRVVQLIGKTNQFNLTTRRHGLEDVKRLLRLPDAIGLVMSMLDRFGDHGLIAVLLGVPDVEATEKTLRIDTWLMSCRVIGRSAEHFLFNALLERASQLGYKHLKGEFVATSKNSLVANLYDQLGFTRTEAQAESIANYVLPVSPNSRVLTFIQSAESPACLNS